MPRGRRVEVAAAAALVVLAAAIRVPALFDGFWIDEVWSWTLARRMTSPVDVLRLAHDNTTI